MWTRHADDTITSATGQIVYFGEQRFLNDICFGDCCFVCGAKPHEKPFNNEHVFPEWLLRHLDLFDKSITLINGATVRYDRYTVPCCVECNSFMGDEIETPVSEAVRGGYDALVAFIGKGHPLAMATWMRLLFVKTHLKDRAMRFHLDERKGQEKIGDLYPWGHLHYTHNFARCFYTGCRIPPEAMGWVLTIPVKRTFSAHRFDFADNFIGQTMLLRLDDIAILTVLDDCGGVLQLMQEKLNRINGPLSELQLRELFVEMTWLNMHLKNRPAFGIDVDLKDETFRIVCDVPPTIELVELDYPLRGRLYRSALGEYFPTIKGVGMTHEETLAAVDSGRFTVLFDSDGKFINDVEWVLRET
ncbi:hypothetical protein [Bradyrhizobium sp.]|uniref:hypothetical protein n=1 Tax=Bradyrhizobium sp. TaxID=376 RepID=UPI00262590DB|nr:hypothetical protein [Bradyrhizobium sp.]